MKVNIVSKGQNPLMKRKEITFSVDHAQNGGTPSRAQVTNQLASLLKTRSELVFVKNLKTKTGTMIAVGQANIYDSIEQAKSMEPKHVIAKNVVPEKKPEELEAPKEEVSEEAPEEAVEKKEEE